MKIVKTRSIVGSRYLLVGHYSLTGALTENKHTYNCDGNVHKTPASCAQTNLSPHQALLEYPELFVCVYLHTNLQLCPVKMCAVVCVHRDRGVGGGGRQFVLL